MSALHARGLSLLHDGRPEAAIEDLQRALEIYPDYPQTHLALARAYRQLGASEKERRELARVDAAIGVVARTKPIEAAMVRAMRLAAAREHEQAAAALERMLADAPPGFAGWTIPLEPLFSELHEDRRFAAVLKSLAARAR
jgi:tetratricopeptide (TPR) repeat protein